MIGLGSDKNQSELSKEKEKCWRCRNQSLGNHCEFCCHLHISNHYCLLLYHNYILLKCGPSLSSKEWSRSCFRVRQTSEFQTKKGDANVTDGKCYSRYWNELKDCNWKAHYRPCAFPGSKENQIPGTKKIKENVNGDAHTPIRQSWRLCREMFGPRITSIPGCRSR